MHAKNAQKLPALRSNPAVALTIDTEVHPPKILLIRGRAELDVVDGIPEEYLQASGSGQMTPEQRTEWEAGVRSLYDGMVRIVVAPDLGEADRLRDDAAERGRGTGPAAGRAPARLTGPPRIPAGKKSPPDVENARPAPSRQRTPPQWRYLTKEDLMANYLLLKHYRSASQPAPIACEPMDQWTPDEISAHIQYMQDFGGRLEGTGEFVDGQGLSPEGTWVRYDGEGRPPVTDGPFAETKDLNRRLGW